MRKFYAVFIVLFSSSFSIAQTCVVGLNSTTLSGFVTANAGSGGANAVKQHIADIYNETTNSCSPGGIADITINYGVEATFDQYGGTVIDQWAGTTHDVSVAANGIVGRNPMGASTTNESSPGDVRCYYIEVLFAPHMNNITAGNFSVQTSSTNTEGEAYESTAIEFYNSSGTAFSPATYSGYFASANNGTGCHISNTPSVNSSPWSGGMGTFLSQSTSTVQYGGTEGMNGDACNPIALTAGPYDGSGYNVLPTNTGLTSTSKIGGFKFKTCLEDVARAATTGTNTTTSTNFTSRLISFTIQGSPLPVQIKDLSVIKNENSSLLSFSTASETNNDFFIIERSADGAAYEAIGTIKGAGNSSREITYEYTDEAPLKGINYYRIKQTDFDGKYSYSEVRSVRFTDGASVTVSPRTTEGRVDITTDMEDYNVEVYTAAGAQVKAFTGLSADQSISIEDLQPGIYFIRVSSGTHSETVRVIKL